MTSIPKITVLLLCLCLISSCGQTGALYLPNESDAVAANVTNANNSDLKAEIRQEQ